MKTPKRPGDEPPLEQQAQELAAAIQRARPGERVICLFRERHTPSLASSVRPELRTYASVLDLFDRISDSEPVGNPWVELPSTKVQGEVADLILHELAYGREWMTRELAAALATRFLSLFGEGARFATTTASTRISDSAQFDKGVAGRDGSRVGILWFESNNPGR